MGYVTLDEAFSAFVAGVEERGPTTSELATTLGLLGKSNGFRWMRLLEEAGYIELIPHTNAKDARRYRLTAKGRALAAENALEAAS